MSTDGHFDALKKLSLVELMDVEVSTAARIPERLFDAAAAIYTVTRDELRRSGVQSIPEALRLVPGVEVAKENSHSWSITMRGFNGDLSNKLLVLIDGRSVYTPLFAGVFWDAQDYPIGEIERIEVVGGPGGTLWGANAVNGVINIITRSAQDSQGGTIGLGGGNEEPLSATGRYGGKIGEWYARGYVKHFQRDDTQPVAGGSGIDDWKMSQAGFRTDRSSGPDTFTLSGDVYESDQRSRVTGDFTLGTLPEPPTVRDIDIRGANLLGRWSREMSSAAGIKLQLYVDRTERNIPGTFSEDRNTFDVDFQQHFSLSDRHNLLWGGGVRYSEDSIGNSAIVAFLPPNRRDWTFSGFVQDKIDLRQDRVKLTVGSKVEHNNYTGAELQPRISLTGIVSQRQMLWGSVSRAVRIPSRLDSDSLFTIPLAIPDPPAPTYLRVSGSRDFDVEEVLAYEAGWRAELSSTVSVDIAAYHNEYENLQTLEPLPPVVVPGPLPYTLLPSVFGNGKDASADGATVAANWQPTGNFRIQLNYAYLDLRVTSHADSLDATAQNVEGNSPNHEFGLQTYLDLPRGVSLYGGLRYVDDLPSQAVSDYVAFDANIIWRASEKLELALTGRNLLDPGHPEFGGGNEIERSWFLRASWRH